MEKKELLNVSSLNVETYSISGSRRILSDVNFSLHENEIIGIAGVNGAGKSTFVSSILGILPENMRIVSGSIKINGEELLVRKNVRNKFGQRSDELANVGIEKLRGKFISIVMQDPSSYLDPLLPIGYQIFESVFFNDRDRLVNRIKSRENLSSDKIKELINFIDDKDETKIYDFINKNFDRFLNEQISYILRREDITKSDKKNMITALSKKKLTGIDKFVFNHKYLAYFPIFNRIYNKILLKEGNNLATEILHLIGGNSSIIDLYPNQLSGGMLQSAMIAIGLINNPKIIILDEPASSIDPIVQYKMFDQLSKSSRNFNSSLILISHDIFLLEKFVDKIAIMDNGTFVEFDDAEEVIKHPKTKYTKSLIESDIKI